MYVAIQHRIHDPAAFWPEDMRQFTSMLPPHLKLLHTFAASDGTHAVCVWEGQSIDAVRDFVEPVVGAASENEYFAVLNGEGIPATPPARAAQRVG